MSKHCKIIITGKPIEGCDAEAVKANLIAAFKLTENQADRFLGGKPLIVKDNLAYQAAEKYRDAFEKAGLACRLEQAGPPSGGSRADAPAEGSAAQRQETLYQVIVAGAVAPGASVPDVKRALAHLYKTDSQKIERLFTGKPVVVKDRLDRSGAERFRRLLEKTGVVCSIQALAPAGAAEPARPGAAEPAGLPGQTPPGAPKNAADELPKCPKCGYQATCAEDPLLTGQGGLGECPLCGIIVAKYSKSAAPTPASPPMAPAHDAEPQPAAEPARADAPAPTAAPAPVAAPAKKVVPPGTTTGIEVTASFFPLAPLLYFCYPHVDIDGEASKSDWGKKVFYPLLPGSYALRIYVPYPSKPEYGLISKEITVGEKNPCRLEYYLFPWTSSPGSLTINGIKTGFGLKGGQPSDQEPGSAWLKIAGKCRAMLPKLLFWKKQALRPEE